MISAVLNKSARCESSKFWFFKDIHLKKLDGQKIDRLTSVERASEFMKTFLRIFLVFVTPARAEIIVGLTSGPFQARSDSSSGLDKAPYQALIRHVTPLSITP